MSYRFSAIGVTKRTEPFLSGGLTMLGALTEPAGQNGFNVGGGLTHWFGREGVRIELREVMFGNGAWTTQYWTVRIGIAFR